MTRWVRFAVAGASVAASVLILLLAVPRAAGVGWAVMVHQLEAIPFKRLLELTALWWCGLYLNSFMLTAALPGLHRRRALALNLGGSSVANVLPFGGAAGVGLNYAMLASWGYDRMRATTYTAVTNAAAAATKLLVAGCGIVAVMSLPTLRGELPLPGARAVGVLVVVAVAASFALAHWRVGLRVGGRRSGVTDRMEQAVTAWRQQAGEVVRERWPAMLFAGVGYAGLQLLLLFACLSTTSASLSLPYVALGFAVDRLLTVIPLTPGGIGVVETGVVASLIGLGGDPAAVAAGVVLYRAFSWFLEIPVGGAVALGWLAQRAIAPSRG